MRAARSQFQTATESDALELELFLEAARVENKIEINTTNTPTD